MQNQPVVLSGALYTLGNALLALVVIMGWFPMTAEQVAAWNAVLAAAIAVGTYFVQRVTTPRANPTDEDGAALSRPDNTPTLAQQRSGKASGKGGY